MAEIAVGLSIGATDRAVVSRTETGLVFQIVAARALPLTLYLSFGAVGIALAGEGFSLGAANWTGPIIGTKASVFSFTIAVAFEGDTLALGGMYRSAQNKKQRNIFPKYGQLFHFFLNNCICIIQIRRRCSRLRNRKQTVELVSQYRCVAMYLHFINWFAAYYLKTPRFLERRRGGTIRMT